jgi:hypothetical protein
MLHPISKVYRAACREIVLSPREKALFMRFLRELSVNAARSRKCWTLKEDFVALWWVSIAGFPELREPVVCGVILDWVGKYLPFELTEADRRFLSGE